ncbi:MAG TPA: hypothetical protein VNM14_02060 [Planctomycetota bacterium]|jgi:hypothetical protein|nr:hypothetical protein [Planctomycetota bacterium]
MFARGEGLRIHSLEIREAAPDRQGWTSIVDGRALRGLAPKSQESWRAKDGALEPLTTGAFVLITRDELPDGDIRVLMEARELSYLMVDVRLTGSGKTRASVERSVLGPWERRTFELLLRCRGEDVTGTLEGQPIPFTVLGRTSSGAIRLQGEGSGVRVHSVEYHPLR